MKRFSIYYLLLLLLPAILFSQTAKRPMLTTDFYKLPSVSDPQIAPGSDWVAYTVSTIDSVKDNRSADIWMISWDGNTSLQLTHSPESENSPRFSPDGKWLSFLSSRQDGKGSQVWLMNRRGGEAKRITTIKGGVNSYSWSADSKKLLFTITEQEPEDTTKAKTPKPIVLNRYQFKQDVEGYLNKKLYTHIYLFDIANKKLDTLTKGKFNCGSAVLSPDGSTVAFVSNQTEDPDKNENRDICTVSTQPGSPLKVLTSWKGADNNPQWSPNGQRIAYTRTTSDEPYIMYDHQVLAVISKNGGEPTLLSTKFDRPVTNPRWDNDATIQALVSDDRNQTIYSFDASNGNSKRLTANDWVVYDRVSTNGKWAAIASNSNQPNEIFALENGNLRKLTNHTDSFLAPIQLATVKPISAMAKDGNRVSGILYQPANTAAGKALPLVLFIHGGPVAQDDYGFNLTAQMLAANGYAVARVNYRGSNGRGIAYSKAINADWGNKEILDLHAIVDELVKQGIADPNRLASYGWSYGGILTDYLIASDNRFKAACSGAGVAFPLALYGVDQYIMQYDNELGPPWKNLDKYMKLSYPFLHADKIKTPTLFLVGEKDFNVPSVGSEQMYQALRSQGIPTELVVYPGQYHGISTPSYLYDRFNRVNEWFKKYLQ